MDVFDRDAIDMVGREAMRWSFPLTKTQAHRLAVAHFAATVGVLELLERQAQPPEPVMMELKLDSDGIHRARMMRPIGEEMDEDEINEDELPCCDRACESCGEAECECECSEDADESLRVARGRLRYADEETS